MLKKIIAIRNVGRFVSSALPGVPGLTKFTLIFGANGYGKTTLSTILRSLGTNDPGLVTGRARVGVKTPPQIELLLDSGTAKFDNGAWNVAAPDITVFDGAFIAENVHSGDAVDLEQRRNLYRVIVGKEGVALALEEERLAAESRAKTSDIRSAERAIQSHVPRDMKLDDFTKLRPDADIDAKIAAQAKTIEAVREADTLKVRAGLAEAALPSLPADFEAQLAKTLEGIAKEAQERIAEHISRHKMNENGEAWLARGTDHIANENCPYCGQSVAGLALVDSYRKVFGEAYRQLKAAIEAMRTSVERDFGDRAVGLLETLLETNRSSVEFWNRYCKLPEIKSPAGVPDALRALKIAAISLLSQKAAAPQDAVVLDGGFAKALDQYRAARAATDATNAAIKAANAEIVAKKAAVASGDLKKEEGSLVLLNAQKKRHDPKVAALCSEYMNLVKDKDALDVQKGEVRAKLEEHANKVIRPYEARINELLDNFNAGFRIAQANSAYPGGVASSTYQLVINNTVIELGDGKTPSDRPSFKNTLSAGDRSTLALAFFLADLERQPDLANKIVIFDDPFTSQDSFRRRQTVHEIRKIGSASKQVIVLSHDATFLRQVRDKCPGPDCVALQLVDHRSGGIKVMPCDLDEACRGRAASDMDDLQTYITTGAGKDRDVVRKMRVVLETYCRATYPGAFAPDDRLGGMVEKIKKVGDQHPAWAAVEELEQINEYSRDHHHGEDPTDGSGDLIDPAELSGFVKRTLRLVNNLQA